MEIIGPDGQKLQSAEAKEAKRQQVNEQIEDKMSKAIRAVRLGHLSLLLNQIREMTGVMNPQMDPILERAHHEAVCARVECTALGKMLIRAGVVTLQQYNAVIADQFKDEQEELERRLGVKLDTLI